MDNLANLDIQAILAAVGGILTGLVTLATMAAKVLGKKTPKIVDRMSVLADRVAPKKPVG